MSDDTGGQSALADFGPGETDEQRPDAEAAAVAGGVEAAEVIDASDKRFPDADGEVDVAVTQVDYSVEYADGEEYPVVHVFGRDGRDPLHVRVLGFEPYFYVPTSRLDDRAQRPEEEFDAILESRETDEEGDPFVSIRGEELTKLIGRTPRDVGQLRDEFEEHYEADILFPNRFLIDKDVGSGIRVPARWLDDDKTTLQVHHEEVYPVEAEGDLRVNTFDIEVDDRSGFPEDGEETIICLTSHDSYRDEYVVWLYDAPDGDGTAPESLPGYDPLTDDTDIEVRSFDTEGAMLDAFVTYIEETDPDVLTGWNFEDFDAPYFLDRLEEVDPETDHDLDPDRLSRIGEVWRSGWGGPDVKGRVVFDLLYGYKRTQFTELESYRLDAVGEVELGVGKERYSGDIGDLWENDPERLLEYNVRDVELCVELDRKQEIIAFWDEVRQFVGCLLEDAPTPGDTVDVYVLHKSFGRFALPTKGQAESEEYEGGAVFDPITGVKENVTVLDLKSLYPMCMVTINASPETKAPDDYDGEVYTAPNGTEFQQEPDGIIREMVDELLTEREEKKALRNEHEPDSEAYQQFDQQQAAVKVIMNCFTPDTDVLTPEGVRNIRDLSVGDEVYSLDPDTEEMQVKQVTETHAYPDYRGELVDIETTKTDFRVTPNHRMLVRKNDKNGITEDGYSFVEVDDLYDYCNYELPHDWSMKHDDDIGDSINLQKLVQSHTDVGITLADGGVKMAATYGIPNLQTTVDADAFIEFLAWYVTEGSTYDAKTQNYRVQVAQEGDEPRRRIAGLVEEFVDYYYVDERSVSFSSRLVSKLLDRLCGSGSANKRIPDLIFRGSKDQKQRFLNTLIEGDGRWEKEGESFTYSTKSERLRDDFLRLCLELGYTPHYTRDSGVWRIHVSYNTKNTLRMYRSSERTQAEDGVYCVTVEDNNTLVAGRNGKFQSVGNSLYGVTGWDRFRLYDKEVGAAVTATGREVIRETEKISNSIGHEVTYGDTDSVMLEIGQLSDDDLVPADEIPEAMQAANPDADERELRERQTILETGFELEEQINDGYDEFAERELNAFEHRFQIEFEKLYRRFFQAGKKKRYAGHIVWKEGKYVDDIDITGFEYKRSDIAPITKRVQREVLEKIVTGAELDEIRQYLKAEIEAFEDGAVDLDEIGIPGGIGKRLDAYETDTAQVRGAKYANEFLGTNFQRGSKPKRLYLEKVHPDFWRRMEDEKGLDPQRNTLYGEFKADPDVICFEYADQVPEEFEIDYEKMLEKTLKGPIERVIEALGMSWDEVKSGQEQTGLGSFM
jgi:DNA polymerase I